MDFNGLLNQARKKITDVGQSVGKATLPAYTSFVDFVNKAPAAVGTAGSKYVIQPAMQNVAEGAKAAVRQYAYSNPFVNMNPTLRKQYGYDSGYTPMQSLKDTGSFLKGVGSVMDPIGNVIGGGIGTTFNAASNLYNKKPIFQNADKAYRQGYDFSATLSPIGALAGALPLNRIAPAVERFVPKVGGIVGKAVEGATKEFVKGAGYGAVTGENPVTTGLSFAPFGVLEGLKPAEGVRVKGTAVYKDDVQHVKEAIDYLSSKGYGKKPQLDVLQKLEKDAEIYKNKLKLVDRFEGGRDMQSWKSMSLEDKYKMIANKLEDAFYTPKNQGGSGMVMSLTDNPKPNSIEQLNEQAQGFKPGLKKEFDTALITKDKELVQKLLPQIPNEYRTRFSTEINNVIGESPQLRSWVPKGSYTNDPSIDNPLLSATPKTDIKNQIEDLRQSANQSILEQKMAKGVLKDELAPFTSQDLQDFSSIRKMVNSRTGQEGDIETLYKKNPELVTKSLERIREVYHNVETDQEALDKLLSLPKKSDTYVTKPTEYQKIQDLKEKLKTAQDMVYHAEPNIYRQRAIFRNQEYRDWSASVFKDTAQKEKETLAKNVDTVVNAIKSSFDDVKPTPKQKVGIFDYLRTPDEVLNKIGLGREAKILRNQYDKYLQELPVEINKITQWSKQVSPEGNKKIFRYLDGSLSNADLTPQELKVSGEIKQYLSTLADKLKLPPEKRITNYITHIFEKDFIKKEFDPEFAKLIRDKIPGSVYDPFTEQRLGKMGYKEDTWAALDAYVKRAVRKINMDPALEQIKHKAETLEESQYDYVKSYIDHINMRPTKLDNLVDNTIKQIVGYRWGQRPLSYLSQKMRQTVSRATLGLNVGSAVKNLSQGVNTYAELGEKYTLIGYTNMIKNAMSGSDELERVGVLGNDVIQDRTINATKKFWEKTDKGLFILFDLAEQINRGSAYYGAKAKALAKGLDEQQAIEYAKKVVRDTQFTFGSIDTPVALSSDITKTMTQFQTYNIKQAEFLGKMARDKNYIGMARYIGASVLLYTTIGKALGWQLKDIIPSFRLDSPLVQETQNFGTIISPASSTNEKKKAIIKQLKLVVPAGTQIGKTIEGTQAVNKGYSSNAAGSFQYGINNNPVNMLRAATFGKSALPETQAYYDKRSPIPVSQSTMNMGFNPLEGFFKPQQKSSYQIQQEQKLQDKVAISELKGTNKQYLEKNGRVYIKTSGGSTRTIEPNKVIDKPKLTTNNDVNKELIKDYKSSITSQINDVVELYKVGNLTAEEAGKKILTLKNQSASFNKGKKLKIKPFKLKLFKAKKIKMPKLTIKSPKIKITKAKKKKKFKTLPPPKLQLK